MDYHTILYKCPLPYKINHSSSGRNQSNNDILWIYFKYLHLNFLLMNWNENYNLWSDIKPEEVRWFENIPFYLWIEWTEMKIITYEVILSQRRFIGSWRFKKKKTVKRFRKGGYSYVSNTWRQQWTRFSQTYIVIHCRCIPSYIVVALMSLNYSCTKRLFNVPSGWASTAISTKPVRQE